MTKRFAMILLGGAADAPIATLDGRTPLEAAHTPHCDAIAREGRQGTIGVIPPGVHPDDDVGLACLLGCDTRGDYPGRGPIEAAARRLRLEPGDVVFRCDFVTADSDGVLDATAGNLPTPQAEPLMTVLNERLAESGAQFESIGGPRMLLRVTDFGGRVPQCVPAPQAEGARLKQVAPRGRGAPRLKRIMRAAGDALANHDINLVRCDLGENPANAIWPWGGGRAARWPRFQERYGVRAALIGAGELVRGLAASLGCAHVEPLTTGAEESAIEPALGRAAVENIDKYDLVIAYAGAPYNAARRGDAAGKVAAIERLDAHVIGPLREALRAFDLSRVLVTATVATLVERRKSDARPVPFCMAGVEFEAAGEAEPFGESAATRSGLSIAHGHELMEYFLRV